MNTRQQTLDRYMDGFRRSDHPQILACLTDNVVWQVHGVRTTSGKAEFDTEIENPVFEGSPDLVVDRTLGMGDTFVVTGTGAGHIRDAGPFTFAFSDIFIFERDLITKIDSYVVPLTTPGSSDQGDSPASVAP